MLLGLAVWQACVSAGVVINEIHYAPADKTVPEEFVELYNDGPAVDISGWYFSEGIAYTFPEGTVIGSGEYLVVAQSPPTLVGIYGPIDAVFGPFGGRLSNDGERVVLRNAQGFVEDEVDYGIGFPWPTLGATEGCSMELVSPDLDNDLGGSWRISDPGLAQGAGALIEAEQTWRYFKGTQEPSVPMSAWRQLAFDDASWAGGRAAIGYGESFIKTTLGDMYGGYTTVYLRKTFTVTDPTVINRLTLAVRFDDGFNAWINGIFVAGNNVPGRELTFDRTASSAREDDAFAEFTLPPPAGYLVGGVNVLAVQLLNVTKSTSSDAFFDCRLFGASGAPRGPTPGARNSVYAANAAPQLRQASHFPAQPVSGEEVLITIKATDPDGVASVELHYQLVDPGAYIELSDAAYAANWTTIAMNDAGLDGDAAAGDAIFSATMPAGLQTHRRLVRFRFTAADTRGATINAPYADDPVPNFAYFVYDGVPAYHAAIQPGSADPARRMVVAHPPEVMASVPVYHLITKKSAAEDATWNSQYGGDLYPWGGTLVYDGEVYDHIRYRMRGGVWRYAMGKNMWKFNFWRNHRFRARDNYGRRYDTSWDKLNFSAIIQQGDYLHRGEQGLFESTGFRLFEIAGLEACKTHYLTFRIIAAADETGPTQYDGDFWGLYLAIEQMDGRFLDEHDLPDGNLYKMEGGTGELNNLGYAGVKDKSDLNAFMAALGARPSRTWWRANVELDRYYAYRSILEAIHHYDNGYGKNYFYYLNPLTERWTQYAWDLDLTWADNMFGNGEEPFKAAGVLGIAELGIEYKNRMREIRDLLYNTDQTHRMIEEYAAIVDPVPGEPALVSADRAHWDYHPVMVSSRVNPSKAGHGRFYQQAAAQGLPPTFQGMAGLMKNYVAARGAWIDGSIAADNAIPHRPTVTSLAAPGYPIDGLTFKASAFSDPQGSSTFGAMKWRAAEVTPAGAPAFDPANRRRYEITPAWQSPEMTAYQSEITIPSTALKIGRTYRVRVRMMDTTKRWSRWSEPIEFTTGAPAIPFPQQQWLRVTELMYHPADTPDLEFIELQNIGAEPVDLTPVSFTDGIEFAFAGSAVTTLGPGELVLVVRNLHVFSSSYDTAGMRIAGQYKKRLENAGERIHLVYGANATIQDFTYAGAWYPPADGGGYSIEIVDPRGPLSLWSDPNGWQASLVAGGTPGAPPGTAVGGRQRPGDANQDGRLDVSDAVAYLRYLFGATGLPAPCDGALNEGGNLALLDMNGDGRIDIADPAALLAYLFNHGPGHPLGTHCLRIEGCPSACR